MHEQLWFTAILNHLFAAPVTALLRALHMNPTYPDAPIYNSFAMEILVFIFLVSLFAAARMRCSPATAVRPSLRWRRRLKPGSVGRTGSVD